MSEYLGKATPVSKQDEIKYVQYLITSEECNQSFHFKYATQRKLDILNSILKTLKGEN